MPHVKIWIRGNIMGRKPRIEYDGAIYHVIQRGNNRENIFDKESDKSNLLNDIVQKQNDLGFKLMGYIIMDNHFHILLQTFEKPLQSILHRINSKYSKYYNRKYDRKGHVFGERYKAILVQDESYLLTLLRYIHQNPVKAGICNRVEEYKWSSDYYYRNGIDKEIDIHVILGSISKDAKIAIKQYKEFIQEIGDIDYGKENWIGEEVFELVTATRVKAIERKRLDEILMETGTSFEEFEQIKAGSRKRNLTLYKVAYARKAHGYNHALKEIGEHIKLTDAAVFKLINKIAH
jgi:putative transposase